MFAKLLLLAAAFQVGPFYEQRDDYAALRPIWSTEASTTDLLWPVFTVHDDWWRFCFFTHYQENREGGYQFEVMPLWFNGRDTADSEAYAGLFPIYGYHPHMLLMYDLEFCLWPVWTRYRMPRPKDNKMMTSNAVLFPLLHWRDDGSWGLWPLYGISHNRSDDQWYALWPLFNWKTAYADRDTAGAGTSWMLWPLYASVERERESQWMALPPFFSCVETPDGWRGRFPLPLVEIERFRRRDRTSVFPFYEHIANRRFLDAKPTTEITRFGWRLVELLPNETRVFPFYVGGDSFTRIWPFYECETVGHDVRRDRYLSLFPIRWDDGVERNWAKFWMFYETETNPIETHHSLLWGLIRWSTFND